MSSLSHPVIADYAWLISGLLFFLWPVDCVVFFFFRDILQLKEFGKAEADCDTALKLEPRHVKSLQRRAAARNALGKHRAALADLQNAVEIDPSSKEVCGFMSYSVLRKLPWNENLESLWCPLVSTDRLNNVSMFLLCAWLETHRTVSCQD